MIAPFQTSYRMAWPFGSLFGSLVTFEEIDTTEEFPRWNVEGDWRVPPAKVCDLLTAKEFTFAFEFSSAAFNAEFEEEFPEDISYSVVCDSGVWKYNHPLNGLQTVNLDYKWDTQAKLFERYVKKEESEFFIPQSLAGMRYLVYLDSEETIGYWAFDIIMVAPIPVPGKDTEGNYLWFITGSPQIASITIEKVDTSGAFPIITPYGVSNVGSSYLGIDDRGGQGQGAGGCFPSLSVSIATHFPA